MDEWDGIIFGLCIGALAFVSIMHSRMLGALIEDHEKVAGNVRFLMDNATVSRETES